MAGSRHEKFGTIFTRMTDLIRAGVVKRENKPLWYDVYAAFAPKRDPLYVKPMAKRYGKVTRTVPEIFYEEDVIRAKFYEVYGNGPKAFDLTKPNFVSTCQRFVEKYSELTSQGEVSEDALFEETGKLLLAEGVVLKRKGVPTVAPENWDSVLAMRLKDMLSELQTGTANVAQAKEDGQVQDTSIREPQ